MNRNRVLFLIGVIAFITGCNTSKKESDGIGLCNQDLVLLKKWIHVPAGVKSATWKVVRHEEGFGPSTTVFVGVLEIDTTLMQSLNFKDKEEGHAVETSLVADCMLNDISASFFRQGSWYVTPKGPAYSPSKFSNDHLRFGYFIKLTDTKIFLYLFSD